MRRQPRWQARGALHATAWRGRVGFHAAPPGSATWGLASPRLVCRRDHAAPVAPRAREVCARRERHVIAWPEDGVRLLDELEGVADSDDGEQQGGDVVESPRGGAVGADVEDEEADAEVVQPLAALQRHELEVDVDLLVRCAHHRHLVAHLDDKNGAAKDDRVERSHEVDDLALKDAGQADDSREDQEEAAKDRREFEQRRRRPCLPQLP
mmetsp:Transcript_9656/g.30624  ORF Transcript_9656/g.30624 Transcript_9656/m.30624 type:complete len:210 (+) Transcript_9656:127-756(+)